MLAPRPRAVQLLLCFGIAALLFYAYNTSSSSSFGYSSIPNLTPSTSDQNDELGENARANATLGFGAILAVSRDGSPRRQPLIQAANVTELEIIIPAQPKWTDADVEHFKNGPESTMQTGSVLAWLGHHNALKWFLDSGLETVLILEDDVDWDIHLRSLQVPLAAKAARTLLSPASSTKENNYYWGDTSTWDLLYLGHCGDYFGDLANGVGPGHQFPENLSSIPNQIFPDRSVPDFVNLHPLTSALMLALAVPERNRVLHRSKFPLCTFGYAVTRAAAWKIMNILAPAKEQPEGTKDKPGAYDVAILQSCIRGFTDSVTKYNPEGLKCYSVNPEFFHHMPGDSHIAEEEAKKGNILGIPPVDVAGAEQVKARGETSNIECGFWGGHFAFPNGNKKKLEFLRTNVGRRGKCLKPGRDELE